MTREKQRERTVLAVAAASMLAFVFLIGPALQYGSVLIWLAIVLCLVAFGISTWLFYKARGL